MMFNVKNAEPEGAEETICDCCKTIPVSHLSLDLDPPVGGWLAFFRERNIEVLPDDLGRLSVSRSVLGELLSEEREREDRLAAQQADQATAQKVLVPVGVPALEGASPFESLIAGGGVVTPAQEFGRPKPNFLEEELAAGRRRTAETRAEAELLKKAQRILEGKDG